MLIDTVMLGCSMSHIRLKVQFFGGIIKYQVTAFVGSHHELRTYRQDLSYDNIVW